MSKDSPADATPAMKKSFKIAAAVVATIGLMMIAVLVALVVVVIVFSDEIADLNSRYDSIEQLTNVATGSNKIGQVGTSAITTSSSVTSSSATPSSVTSGSSSFEAL